MEKLPVKRGGFSHAEPELRDSPFRRLALPGDRFRAPLPTDDPTIDQSMHFEKIEETP